MQNFQYSFVEVVTYAKIRDEATQDCEAEGRVDLLLLIEINDSEIQISNGNFSLTTFALVSSSRNRFCTFRISLLSLSLAGVFSKFQGEGPTKRSCERSIKKPVESTRLTRADIFARVYIFPFTAIHFIRNSCPTQGRYYGFYDYCRSGGGAKEGGNRRRFRKHLSEISLHS